MTSQSGGGGGIKGVTSDGLTPGGEVIAGALSAGNQQATDQPTSFTLTGFVNAQDSVGNNAAGLPPLSANQNVDLTADSAANALAVGRFGGLNGHQYTAPCLWVGDETASTSPVLQVQKQNVTQFQVDGDGVQVHGKFKTGASAAHVLGAYSGNAVPIYDEAGTLLGYMPLYA